MSAINIKTNNVRKELKPTKKLAEKVDKRVVKQKPNPNTNSSIHNNKNNKSNAKQTEVETRSNLIQRIKNLEEELEKYDFDRNRITQELDRVCEEKDNQIRELKTLLHEKQLEIDHQMCSFRRQRNEFEDELNKFKAEIEDLKVVFKNREDQLNEKNTLLENQLLDLNDYIANKEQTLAKIRQLEEILKQERVFHQKIKEKLINELECEKQKVEVEVTARVEEIMKNLEISCMNKLSIDARIALEKFVELSQNYEMSEKENRNLRKDNQTMKSRIQNQRIRLEVSESLLHEMLKQLNRKIHNKKSIGVQTSDNMNKKFIQFS